MNNFFSFLSLLLFSRILTLIHPNVFLFRFTFFKEKLLKNEYFFYLIKYSEIQPLNSLKIIEA